MRKLVLSSLIAVLLSGCATAHQQTEQEKALIGPQTVTAHARCLKR